MKAQINSEKSIELPNIEDTKIFARQLALTLENGTHDTLPLVLLYGPIGAGKTVICREIISALCDNIIYVNSPTFNISYTYNTVKGNNIYHYDLYRIKSIRELAELNLEEDLISGICLIEWPEIAMNILNRFKARYTIHLT